MTQEEKLDLSSDLDEAAEKYAALQPEIDNVTYHDSIDISDPLNRAFIAGAEWMAKQLAKGKTILFCKEREGGYTKRTDFTSATTSANLSGTLRRIDVTDGKPHNPSMLE